MYSLSYEEVSLFGIIKNILGVVFPHIAWILISLFISIIIALFISYLVTLFIKKRKKEKMKSLTLCFTFVFSFIFVSGGYYLKNQMDNPYSKVRFFLDSPLKKM